MSHESILAAFREQQIARRLKWDTRFLELAKLVGNWSKDPSTKVGAVLTRNRRMVAVGYNGFPEGLSDDPALYADRDAKLARMIHAELNAIFNANGPVRGTTLYTSVFSPCDRCAAHVIQAGIARVVYEVQPQGVPERWQASMDAGLAMLREKGIPTVGIKL